MIKRLLRLVGRWARKPVNHTSWVAVVTPTDRPKSVRNRCFNRTFLWRCLLSLYPFDISVGVGAFVIGLSQISSFFSANRFLNSTTEVLILKKTYFLNIEFMLKFLLC